jgi:hypothetical protein
LSIFLAAAGKEFKASFDGSASPEGAPWPISALREQAGFHVTHLTAGHMKRGPKPMTFLYEGSASRD